MLKIILALRNNEHQVEVFHPSEASRPVLGRKQAEEQNRRINVVKQWGGGNASPRMQAPEAIDIPLSQRTQTILSHQVSPELRNRLNGAAQTMTDSRKQMHKKSAEFLDNVALKKPVE